MLYIGRHPGTRYGTEISESHKLGGSMEQHDKAAPVDPETILFTLDQLGQTVEVMNKVIAKLRGYVYQNVAAQKQHELDFGGVNVQPGKIGPNGLH
jgi:hypothetical protein